MNEYQLSKRLKRVGDFVPDESRLADIGSDHAYLPVYLMLEKKISFAVAGEVVKGPYESAKQQIKKNALEAKIQVRLADGLDAIEENDRINVITICGMGGSLIRDILEKGWLCQKIQGDETLILQPNVGEKFVRDWLTEHGYVIQAEDILEENNKIYEIIVATRESRRIAYSEKKKIFGPKLLEKKSAIFRKKWQQELKQKKIVIDQLAKAKINQEEKIEVLQRNIAIIKEVLASES